MWKRLAACLQPATRIAKTATHLGFTFSNFVASRTWFASHLVIAVAQRCALAVDFDGGRRAPTAPQSQRCVATRGDDEQRRRLNNS